jgi:arylsulfatase A-like enzyme
MALSVRPNILLLHCHDLGDFLGCYGVPVATPCLDALARDGVLFENHFATGTVCTPSRGSLMTGCYPHTSGLMGLVHRGWALDTRHFPPLPALLRGKGYRTLLCGVQHEHWDPKQLGYDRVVPIEKSFCDLVTPAFEKALPALAAGRGPFFASVGFYEPHRLGMNPSYFKRDIFDAINPSQVRVPPWLPDIPEIRYDLAEFYGAVNTADKMAGRILTALDENGLRDNTLVVFTTDHGPSFIHAKGTLYDGGVKTAMIMRHPSLLPRGRRVDAFTSHVDFPPTILELIGLKPPRHVQGQSAVRAARGMDGPQRKYVFAENNFTNFFDPGRMVRSHRYKYIRKGVRTCVFDNLVPEIELSRHNFRKVKTVFDFYSKIRYDEELYDLESDPGELRNLAGSRRHGAALREMRRTLDAHMKKTRDPFRRMRNEIMMPADTYRHVIHR